MKYNKSRVFVLCGVHNHLIDTQNLLECLTKQKYKNTKIVIIDDGSTDDTQKFIEQHYPQAKLLKGNGKFWWTGAMYWGVEEVLKIANTDDFILTINNDCTFDDDFINTLVSVSYKYNLAIVGSLIIDNKDRTTIADAGSYIDWKTGKFIRLGSENISYLPQNKQIEDKINILPTRGTLVPIKVFLNIGNFDKKHFPHYLSDYEFACRAKKNGFKLILSYQAIVYNDTARTGLWKNERGRISLKETWDLLFSRRSKLNIIDNFKFIKYCCPKEYKFRNYVFLLQKIIVSGYRVLFQ